MAEKELAEDLYKSRDDSGEWGETRVDIKVKPSKTEVVSFRMPSTEVDLLEEAAQAHGESVSEFLRRAVLSFVVGERMPDVEIVTGGDTRAIVNSVYVGDSMRTSLRRRPQFRVEPSPGWDSQITQGV